MAFQVPTYSSNEAFDDLLRLCWHHQECSGCLRQGPCSWCPTVCFLSLKSCSTLTIPVINVYPEHIEDTHFCSHIQPRHLSFMVRALGASNTPSGLPCVHNHAAHVYHFRPLNLCGDWPGCPHHQVHPCCTERMEESITRLVEVLEKLPRRMVEKLDVQR